MTIELTYKQKMEVVLGLIPDSKNKKALADFLVTQPINFFETSAFTMQLTDALRKG